MSPVADVLNFLQYGIGAQDLALLINRLVVGAFFVISGYHKLFNADRHQALSDTLKACGVPFVGFCCWFVPLVEFFGGLAAISGILAPFASLGMFVILMVAILTDGLKRIPDYKPIDWADWLDDFLYLPEVIYAAMLLVVILAGSGKYTLWPVVVWWFS